MFRGGGRVGEKVTRHGSRSNLESTSSRGFLFALVPEFSEKHYSSFDFFLNVYDNKRNTRVQQSKDIEYVSS